MDKQSYNKNLPEIFTSLPLENYQRVFKGKRFDVYTLDLNKRKRELIIHPGAVVIVPILDKDHLIMIRNQRFAVGKELWELPAGTLEPNESPLETAGRELIEETGYKAGKITELTHFYTTPGICNELMYAYLATDLTPGKQALEDTEQITVEIVSWQKALQMARDGIIIDGKTLAALLFYQAFFR